MYGVNKIILIGHVAADPDLKYVDNTEPIIRFPLLTATCDVRKTDHTDPPEWHNIVMWNSVAKAAHRTLKKGKLVYIEGKNRTRCLEDEKGNKKHITEVAVDYFTLLGRDTDFE